MAKSPVVPPPLAPMPIQPRRAERQSRNQQPVELHLHRDGQDLPVTSKMADFSPSGIGLIHAQPLARGEQFTMNLRQGHNLVVRLLYNVVYCNPDPSTGQYHVGAEFLCVVPPDFVLGPNAPDADPAATKCA